MSYRVFEPNLKGRGVVVKLRDGSVITYTSATDFITGLNDVLVVRREPGRKTKYNSSPSPKMFRIAFFPVSIVARVELAGKGKPAPKADPPKRGGVSKAAGKR